MSKTEQKIARYSRLGTWLIRLLGATWRYRAVNEAPYRARRDEGRSCILVLWHGQLLPLLYFHRRRPISILISEHKDGEIIARVASNLGLSLVRGSSSRGAARALVGLVRELERGYDIAITPDGPRGPAKSIAPGALITAQRSGAPIVPLAVHVSRAWRLTTWDEFIIPKPFAKITVAYGTPMTLSATTAREAADAGDWLREQMGLTEDAARD